MKDKGDCFKFVFRRVLRNLLHAHILPCERTSIQAHNLWRQLVHVGKVDKTAASLLNSRPFVLGGRPMVGLQTLDLAIGVRVPASQPFIPISVPGH
jgi:hypothetical protein